MVQSISFLGSPKENKKTSPVKTGTIAGLTGAAVAGVLGSFSAPHFDLEKKELSDKFVRQLVKNMKPSPWEPEIELTKELMDFNPKKVTLDQLTDSVAKNPYLMESFESLEEMKQFFAKKAEKTSVEDTCKWMQKEVTGSIKSSLKECFDEEGFLRHLLDEGAIAGQKEDYNLIKKTLRQLQLKSVAKWALIGGAVIGGIGFLVGGKGKKDVPPVQDDKPSLNVSV